MDWNTVEKQIVVDDQNKWDWKTSGEKLRVLESGALALGNGHGEPTNYALSDRSCANGLRSRCRTFAGRRVK